MTTNAVIGWVATMGSIIYLSVGLPVQIYKNYRNQSASGVSLLLIVFMGISILLWLAYALTKQPRDWFIFAANFPGFVFLLPLLVQFYIYRKK